MRSVFVLMTAAVLVMAVSGVALAQSYPSTPPAQQPPSQTAPAQAPAQPAQPAPTTPAPTAPAQTPATPGQTPSVSNLKPFSAEADFMSLAGYLRYLMYQQTNQWVTYAEATRVVKQQTGQ